MSTLLPIRARTELARQFHRTITNTINVPVDGRNSLTPINNTLYYFIAATDQSTFEGEDEYEKILSYMPGKVDVFVNGVKLKQTDYFATNGTSIILVTPSLAGDSIMIATFSIYTYPNPSDFYYVYIGKTTEWTNDSVAPTLLDSRIEDSAIKRNILAVKRVQPSDTTLMIPRVNWETGTVYSAYRDNTEFYKSSLNFYVMNSSFRIYKCLFSPGTASTVEPSHTTAGPFQVADGYYWQIMYEVPVSDRIKFLTNDFIPIKFYSTSSTFDHNGVIDDVIVTNGGTGYSIPPTVLVLGDGEGAEVSAVLTPGGEISDITVVNAGYGYSFALIQILGGNGNGATAEVVLRAVDLPLTINQDVASHAISSAGAINFMEIENGGIGYTSSTIIDISGDGVGAIAVPIVSLGTIVGIQIIDSGRGYTFANVTALGAGAGASIRAMIEPQGGHGSNVPQELMSTVVGVTINIEDVLEDFFTGNDFRQVGVIKNIKNFYETEQFSSLTGNNCYAITVTDPSKYDVDNTIKTDEGGTFIVVNKKDNDIFLLPVVDYISIDSILSNETLGHNNLIINRIVLPEVSTKNGDIIYARNMLPVNRIEGQTEQVKLYFGF